MGVINRTTISPSQGALSADAYLRIASLSIAAYEYVASCVSLPFMMTHLQQVISSPSLRNIGCTPILIERGKKVNAGLRRSSLNSNEYVE